MLLLLLALCVWIKSQGTSTHKLNFLLSPLFFLLFYVAVLLSALIMLSSTL